MTYPWFELSDVFTTLISDIVKVELSVFSHDVYIFNGVERHGASGKTCWYIPLSSSEAKLFGIERDDVGLKIIKYPVYGDIKDEYSRLLQEFSIQKILFANGMAPDVFKILLINNAKYNSMSWLRHEIQYPAGSIFFAMLVENIESDEELTGVETKKGGFLLGDKIDAFRKRCLQLRIEPYDLTCENMYQIDGQLGVLDVHKWRRTYSIGFINAPKYLQLELNNTCNARCSMCAIPKMRRQRGIMSDNLLVKILKEADALGVEYLTPFLHGEPFMREDFIEKLRMINKYAPRAKITIFTNASLLNERNAVGIRGIKNIEQIVFSFPGGNKKVYEATTGLDFANAVRNIRNAFGILKGFNLRISMPRCELNKESETEFKELWAGYPHSAYDTYNYLGDVCGTLAKPCYEQCDRAFRTMTVLFDGRVCLCCMDAEGRFIMGDLSKESISDVWHGEKFSRLRAAHGCCRLAYAPCRQCTQDLKTEEYNDA